MRAYATLSALLLAWSIGCSDQDSGAPRDTEDASVTMEDGAQGDGPGADGLLPLEDAPVTMEDGDGPWTDGLPPFEDAPVTIIEDGAQGDGLPPLEDAPVTMEDGALDDIPWEGDDAPASPEDGGPPMTCDVAGPDGEMASPPPYRTSFAPCEAGWEQFQELAEEVVVDGAEGLVVKFLIDRATDTTYFQNTEQIPLHYEFAHSVLGWPLSREEFEASTYSGEDRAHYAGDLIWYPALEPDCASLGGHALAPLVIEFFPTDDLSPTMALDVYLQILAQMAMVPREGNAQRLIYRPAGAQQEAELLADTKPFVDAGAAWILSTEFFGGRTFQAMNPGEAYGTLRLIAPEETDTVLLSYRDIALFPRLPLELSIVGGTITEELQTPLAHVNVAAQTRGTPNMALLGAAADPRVEPHIGTLVHFVVEGADFLIEPATQEEAEAFWQEHLDRPIQYPEADLERRGLTALDDITFYDSLAFGVKAANTAELHRILGDQAPDGYGLPMAHYEDHITLNAVTLEACAAAHDDCLEEDEVSLSICEGAWALCDGRVGLSIRDYIAACLDEPAFLAGTELRASLLDGVRHMIRHAPVDPTLAMALDQTLAERFGNRNVRLRSSTNAEDLEDFSGAGLYDSYSANALDPGDLPSEEITKVWASVWNFRAYEERAYWGIDHLSVHMAVLIHQAFPDEAANGVLITQNLSDPMVQGYYVNVQAGEVSVTNPEDGALPEVFTIIPGPNDTIQVRRERYSSLSPDVPLLSDDEVLELYTASTRVLFAFAPLYDAMPWDLALDMEFKFEEPDRALFIKQVRPYTVGGP